MKEAANCGGLDRRDKTLGAPALRAFVDVMYETRLFFLDTRKPHLPLAFEAERLLRERLRRGLRFHAEILADSLGTRDPPGCTQPGFSFVRPWLGTEKGTELFEPSQLSNIKSNSRHARTYRTGSWASERGGSGALLFGREC